MLQALLILGFFTIFFTLAVSIFIEYTNIRNLESDFSRGLKVHSNSMPITRPVSFEAFKKIIETDSGQYKFLNESQVIFSVKNKSMESFRLSNSSLFYKGLITVSNLEIKVTIKYAISIVIAITLWWFLLLGMLVYSFNLGFAMVIPVMVFGILAVVWHFVVGRSAHNRILKVLSEVQESLWPKLT